MGHGIEDKQYEGMSKEYAILAKKYLRVIKTKYNEYVDTKKFTYMYDNERNLTNNYDVNYLSNTHIFEMITKLLEKYKDRNRNISNLDINSTPRLEGHRLEGHRLEGHRSEGHRLEGHRSEGHRSEGHRSEGHRSEGHRSERHRSRS